MPVRCLIVDDSLAFLEVARELLEREGLDVAGIASSGGEAIEKVRALRPDVVLVDIALGEESGLELARRLHADAEASSPTVILISTRAEADFSELIAASPAAGFLPKSELSADAIRHLADASRAGS